MHRSTRASILSLALGLFLATPLCADDGNGVGSAYLAHGPVRIGSVLEIEWGSPGLAGAQSLLVISDGIGPTNYQGIDICIDVYSPSAQVVFDGQLDATGKALTNVGIANVPGLTTLPPIYGIAVVVDFTIPSPFVSLSKTVAFRFENTDGSSSTAPLGEPRALHTVTALQEDARDNEVEVLIAGGGSGSLLMPVASATTEIFSPLTRSYRPGPVMASARAFHQAVRLDDGKVLICGGADATGVGLASCELFDPATESLVATGSMGQGRVGHQATLLADGRVLVTGGVPSFDGVTLTLEQILDAALATGEVYDPGTGAWTAVNNNMSSPRFVHAQTLLQNGQVIVTGGINAGANITIPFVVNQDYPTYTAGCDLYDPPSNAFISAPSLPTARAGHGIGVLPDGSVLVTGGIENVTVLFAPVPTVQTRCDRLSGAAWVPVAPLATAAALHAQISASNGDQVVVGGLTGDFLNIATTSAAGRHDGTAFTPLANSGTNPGDPGEIATARGIVRAAPLYDGTWLLSGGTDGVGALVSSLVYLAP